MEKTTSAQSVAPMKSKLLIGAVAVLLTCAISGVVFAAWVNNGPQILLSLGSSALAWCF